MSFIPQAYPKYDEQQGGYYTNSMDQHSVFGCPVTLPESEYEFMGVVTEALNAESYKTVTPAFYDIALKNKYTEDPVTAQMIDLILGYDVRIPRGGRFDVEKAKARGVPQRLWSKLQKGESLEGFTPSDVLGETRRGIHVTYVTDTRPVGIISTMAAEADLLICEGGKRKATSTSFSSAPWTKTERTF